MANIPVEHVNTRAADGNNVRDRWWIEEEPAPHVTAIVKQLESQSAGLNDQRLIYARLYANQPLSSLYSLGILRRPSPSDIGLNGTRLTYNICQSAVDTASAKIAKNKPRVLFLTSGGDWRQKRRAAQLTKYCDGLFYGTDFYEIGQQVFVDACVFGTGLAKIFAEDGEIKAERVLECEVFVNEGEAINGRPRSMYQRMYIHREVAAAQWGSKDNREKILHMPGVDLAGVGANGRSDMIQIIEAWHLPSAPKAGDGRHALVIGDVTVWSKKYDKDYFPFVKLVWNPRIVGWRGQGLVEQLAGVQLEINKLLVTIQKAQHLMAVPRIFVERGSKIDKAHINNDIGAIIDYTGTPPQIVVGQAVPPELYEQLDRHWAKGFEVTGISQLSATAQKPAGLNSAVALREYHDVESERFVVVGQRYENWFIDAARIMIDISRELYASNKELQVKAPGTKLLEEIKWSEVNLKEDAYVMRAFPTSILPTTPAGRLQKVQELFEAQFIDKDTAMSLLDFPDLESAMGLQTAAMKDIENILNKIMEKGEVDSPEPYMNLALAVRMAQSAYLKARVDGAPEDRREKILRFIEACRDLQQPAEQQAAPPQQPAAAPAPPAAAPPPDMMPEAGPMMGAGPQDMTALPSNVPALPPG